MNKLIILAGLFASLAIFVLGKLGTMTGLPILIAPFRASCVLIFGHPDSPFTRPKNLIFGHLICSGIGLAFLFLDLNNLISVSIVIATGLSITVMLKTDTTHPAAGANPIFIIMSQTKWTYLIYPILITLSFIYRKLINSYKTSYIL